MRVLSRRGASRALLHVLLASSILVPPALAQDGEDEEIVVTAQRRKEAANTVGMPIQAFGGEQLKELRITSTQDLTTVAPSFTVSRSYQGVPIFTLRGIGFNTINLAATSTVGTYVDEVAYAYPFMMTGPVFDLQRVEVLKGPQGTLYGRNTTGGLIDFITSKPDEEAAGSLTFEVGNFGTANTEGYATGKIAEGLLGRLSWRTEDSSEGWQRSSSRDDELGEIHRYGARAALAWEASDKLSFDVSASGWINKSDSLAGQAIGFTPATNPLTGTSASHNFNTPGVGDFVFGHDPGPDGTGDAGWDNDTADWAPGSVRGADIGTGLGLPGPLEEDNTFWALSLTTRYDIDESLRVVALTGYQELERDALFDWSGAPYQILAQDAHGTVESFSQEIRVEGESDNVSWLFGGYYAKDEVLDSNRTLLGDNANSNFIAFVTATLLGTPFNIGYTPEEAAAAFRTYTDVGNLDSETWSLFGNVDWTFSDEFKVTAGLRYTQDEHSYRGCSRDFNGNMLPNVNTTNRALFLQLYGLLVTDTIGVGDCVTFDPDTATFGELSHTLEEDNVAWRVVANYTPEPGLLFYGSISRGAKSGTTPINAANLAEQQLPVSQELLLAYEAGVKARLADGALQVNASAFYYDYDDKQISALFADPIYTALSRLQNIPESNAWGLDADITWRITEGLTAVASATYLETEVENFESVNAAGQTVIYDGVEFPYSPNFQGALTLTYDTPLNDDYGFQAAVNGRWQSDSAVDFGDDPRFAIKSYGLLNASMGVYALNDTWRLSVWGRNLTDEYYWTSVASNANLVVRFPGMPTTYGASLTVNF